MRFGSQDARKIKDPTYPSREADAKVQTTHLVVVFFAHVGGEETCRHAGGLIDLGSSAAVSDDERAIINNRSVPIESLRPSPTISLIGGPH